MSAPLTPEPLHTLFGKVVVEDVASSIDKAVAEERKRTSCSHVHPEYEVYHPEGHPERALFS